MHHVRNTTPLVTGEQSHCISVLVQNLGTGDKPKRDLTAFSLIKSSQIAGVEFDLPIAERKVIAGDDPIDRPCLGTQESGRGRKLQTQSVDLAVRLVLDTYSSKNGDGVLVGSIGEA
ncbi:MULTISPECIES: hypothetical protein [unclassified Mesorhizobium]|uniref:hypothetical protein n=1 Tax=unclassified Mesorhizobium TaxID=325217 RepID=UPI001FCBDBEE|nr:MULTISPECIES: hypothetical protein [unclassified Mesorhizobium]